MMIQTTDLWGEFRPAEGRTPLAILREQAALLGDKTKHLVEARVVTRTEESAFFHSLRLVVPALDQYTYELFTVHHGVDLYPVTAYGEARPLKTEDEFVEWLRARLSSEATKRIISNLMSQAAA
jgi:hypothetical protein